MIPFAAILSAVGALLPKAVELFDDDPDKESKLEKIGGYASKALAKVPGYAEKLIDLFDRDDKVYTKADFAALTDRIDAADDRSGDLNQAAKDRESGQGDESGG
jgi:hypothetical protein